MILQPPGIVVHSVGVRRTAGLIPRKHDFLHVLVEAFLLGAEQNHSWLCPVSDPEGSLSGGIHHLGECYATGEHENRGSDEKQTVFHGFLATSVFVFWFPFSMSFRVGRKPGRHPPLFGRQFLSTTPLSCAQK